MKFLGPKLYIKLDNALTFNKESLVMMSPIQIPIKCGIGIQMFSSVISTTLLLVWKQSFCWYGYTHFMYVGYFSYFSQFFIILNSAILAFTFEDNCQVKF